MDRPNVPHTTRSVQQVMLPATGRFCKIPREPAVHR